MYIYIYIFFFFSLSLSMSMYASAQVSSSRSELTAWKSTLEAAHQALVDACAAAKGVDLGSGVPMVISVILVIWFFHLLSCYSSLCNLQTVSIFHHLFWTHVQAAGPTTGSKQEGKFASFACLISLVFLC